jgi:hypothetical protein
MIGSSGNSTGPHLHFQVMDDEDVSYEPHAGDCRLGDPYWRNQLPHGNDEDCEIYLYGMSTVHPFGPGRIWNRPPDVHHVKQDPVSNPHYLWYKLKYGHAGDMIRMIYRDPSDSVYRDETVTLGQYHYRYNNYWTTDLPTRHFLGTWTIELRHNEVTQTMLSFEYDEADYVNPVVEERTVAVAHGVAVGDLRGSDADSGLMEFRLVTPPSHGRVTLS